MATDNVMALNPEESEGHARPTGGGFLAGIGNSSETIGNIAKIAETADGFTKTPLGKLVMRELGISTKETRSHKKEFKVEVLFRSLRDFLIPVAITITGCYVAFYLIMGAAI